MKLKKVVNTKDITLKDISSEIVLGDGSIKRIILRDKVGGYLEFSVENYSVHAYVPAPPEMKDVWKISGVVSGIKFEEVFNDEYTAKNKFVNLDGTSGIENLMNEKISVLKED